MEAWVFARRVVLNRPVASDIAARYALGTLAARKEFPLLPPLGHG